MIVMEEVDANVLTRDLHDEEEQTETEIKPELRDLPPAHYLFKIENFSLLSRAKIDNYESSDFEVGGYKWKLSLYPKGVDENNKHISLYLVLSESNSLPFHREVNVSFKLFVYNQIRDKYLAVQDGKERVSRFRGTITSWGFNELVPLNVFNDASNGYLVDDCCIFGAEVFVLDRTGKGEASIVKKLGNNTYTWIIKNYGKRNEEFYISPDFVIGGFKWTLNLYPNGHAKEMGKSLSMYLNLKDSELGERLHVVEYIMRIRNRIRGGKDREKSGKAQFFGSSNFWGFSDFMPLSYLKEPSQGYVLNLDGIMIVELQILLLTVVKDFS